MATGEKSRDAAASSAVGHRAGGIGTAGRVVTPED
jgi:hypothetical protein